MHDTNYISKGSVSRTMAAKKKKNRSALASVVIPFLLFFFFLFLDLPALEVDGT